MGWEESGFNFCGVMGPAHVLLLFYMNVSGMCPQSHLFYKPLMIPAPWVLLHISGLSTPLNGSNFGDCLQFPCRELGS